MPISPQAAALRSQPGYAPRKAHTSTYGDNYPALSSLPSLPALPNEGAAPNRYQRGALTEQFGKLPEKYNPQLTAAQGQASAALAGFGGWSFQKDDPATPEREDLLLNFDPNARLGQREKGAVREVKNAANAQGMLNSSFANQNIGAALQRMSVEAQQIANQYASDINGIYSAWSGEAFDISRELTSLYGDDALWFSQNPPTPPQPITPDTQPRRQVWQGSVPQPNYEAIWEKQGTQNVWFSPHQDGGVMAFAGGSMGAGRRIWKGADKPNVRSLIEKQGGRQIRVAKAPDGGWEAFVAE